MDARLCPRCGAYWQCDCRFDDILLPPSAADLPVDSGCLHDWIEAIGVEVDEGFDLEEARVLVCRLCGLYSVEECFPTNR
jgi:hypothetical protein